MRHLASNLLNDRAGDWKAVNLSHVATAAAFEAYLSEQVRAAKQVRLEEVERENGTVAVRYEDSRWRCGPLGP